MLTWSVHSFPLVYILLLFTLHPQLQSLRIPLPYTLLLLPSPYPLSLLSACTVALHLIHSTTVNLFLLVISKSLLVIWILLVSNSLISVCSLCWYPVWNSDCRAETLPTSELKQYSCLLLWVVLFAEQVALTTLVLLSQWKLMLVGRLWGDHLWCVSNAGNLVIWPLTAGLQWMSDLWVQESWLHMPSLNWIDKGRLCRLTVHHSRGIFELFTGERHVPVE